jgi:hypothetical protein
MFKASSPPDDPPPGWTASEFDQYKEYMGNNWRPPAHIGHNNPPAQCEDSLAGLTPRQLYIDCIWISDEDTCTKIMLLCVARYMTKRLLSGSSMSYRQIASDCGFSEATAKRIGKRVRGVGPESRRRWLKVEVGKGRYVPGKGSENLYLGIIPPDLLMELRRRKGGVSHRYPETIGEVSEEHPETNFGVSDQHPEPHRGITEIQAGYQGDTLTPHIPKKVRGVPPTDGKVAMAAALGGQAAFANRNIVISNSGKISIGEEFRAELRETYTDSQIERGIERAPSQAGGSADLVKLLAQIRRCCSYAKQDDAVTDKKLAIAPKGQSARKTYER